jgi:hypothetical protein
MSDQRNHREAGARRLPSKANADAHDDFSQDPAENRKPMSGVGRKEPVDDVNEKTVTVARIRANNAGLRLRRRKLPAQDLPWPSIPRTLTRPKMADNPALISRNDAMADDKSKVDNRDRQQIAADQDHDVLHLLDLDQVDITWQQALELIKRFGNNRETLMKYARNLV